MTPFQKKVYSLLKKVPKGKVTTYGALAKKLKSSPRAIGQAMRANPFAPRVPCHRVIKSDGNIGGFRGRIKGKAISEKIRLLRKEGVKITDNQVNDNKLLVKNL
ncbi:MGMT family protein [Candidatus Woesearchaeota archaeon]|nr:MGMT family protein [Candidatus Woesearchaeota archaeon]